MLVGRSRTIPGDSELVFPVPKNRIEFRRDLWIIAGLVKQKPEAGYRVPRGFFLLRGAQQSSIQLLYFPRIFGGGFQYPYERYDKLLKLLLQTETLVNRFQIFGRRPGGEAYDLIIKTVKLGNHCVQLFAEPRILNIGFRVCYRFPQSLNLQAFLLLRCYDA